MIALKRLGLLPIFTLYMIFPLTYSIGKWGLHYGPSALYVGLRMVLSGAVLAAWYFMFKRSAMLLKKEDLWSFFTIGFFAFFCTFIPEFWALPHVPIAKVSLYFALAPFFTALFSVLHKLEVMSLRKLIGLAVGFLGFLPMLFINNTTGCASPFLSFNRYDIAVLFSVASYAYGWILIKKLSKKNRYDDAWINCIGMIFGGILSLMYVALISLFQIDTVRVIDWTQFGSSIIIISAVGMFCYLLYTALLHHFSATLVSFFCFLEVPFALLLGAFFLQESVSYVFFISTALIALGLYLFYQEELRLRRQ